MHIAEERKEPVAVAPTSVEGSGKGRMGPLFFLVPSATTASGGRVEGNKAAPEEGVRGGKKKKRSPLLDRG